MTFSIKRLVPDQWGDLRLVRLQALNSDASVFGSNYEKESAMTEADWRSWLQTNDTAIFVVYEGASPVGMTAIAVAHNDDSKRRAVLWGSWLEPRTRGMGLSKAMYEARIAWAKEHLRA